MAAGILVNALYTSRCECVESLTWIEITPLGPDQRSYLRREAPSPSPFVAPLRGALLCILIITIFSHSKTWATNKCVIFIILYLGSLNVLSVATAPLLAPDRELCSQFCCFKFYWGCEVVNGLFKFPYLNHSLQVFSFPRTASWRSRSHLVNYALFTVMLLTIC